MGQSVKTSDVRASRCLTERLDVQFGKTPLMAAARYGQKGVVSVLLKAGASVDATDKVRTCLRRLLWFDGACCVAGTEFGYPYCLHMAFGG